MLADIRERNAQLADRIKDIMFVFDDLVHLQDRDLQTLLMEVELLGRVRVSDVDEAQNNIMEVARRLEAEQKITLAADETSFIE